MVARPPPRIFVWPPARRDLEDAVRAGGGRVVPLDDAEAMIWAGDEPELLASSLHDGIRWVQLSAAGVDLWLEAGVMNARVTWTSAKGGVYGSLIAEYVIGMIIAAAREFHRGFSSGSWDRRSARSLAGSTVGIVGGGGIGRALLKRLRPFDLRSLVVTRQGSMIPEATSSLAPSQLDDLLRESDWVVVTAPATPATRGLIGARELTLIRDSAWLINVSRGALIHTDALVSALEAGALAGAVLDVTEPEPLPSDHVLRTLRNVILTPHVAATPEAAAPALQARVRENVCRFGEARELVGVVDLGAGY